MQSVAQACHRHVVDIEVGLSSIAKTSRYFGVHCAVIGRIICDTRQKILRVGFATNRLEDFFAHARTCMICVKMNDIKQQLLLDPVAIDKTHDYTGKRVN